MRDWMFRILVVGTFVGAVLGVMVAKSRGRQLEEQRRGGVEVVVRGSRHLVFFQDSQSLQRLVDFDEHKLSEAKTYYFFRQDAGWEVFVERADWPQSRERLGTIPPYEGLAEYWRAVGEQVYRQRFAAASPIG